MILVIGAKKDPSVSRVVGKLNDKGIETVIFDPFQPQLYTIEQDSNGLFSLFHNNKKIPERSIIWNRKKIFEGTGFYFDIEDKRAAKVLENEWNGFYQNLLALYEGKTFNSVSSLRNRSKIKQCILAKQAGLNIAPSIVSNNKSHLVDFSYQQQCVIKTLSGRKIPPKSNEADIPYNFMTLRLEQEHLLDSDQEELSIAPTFLMPEIVKEFELRIVVTGHDLLAFKVDSQQYNSTETDWRFGNLSLDFTCYQLPDYIKHSILKYMELAELTFGSIDMIVDKQGNFVFLECNQDGIWEWLEPVCGFQISTNYANTLANIYSHIVK
ncbi:hypothetical protein [Pseudoalteromonas piscicida]|uniref:ATP-grasp domain-containing protein n=1 Tax=Pseudoalteromonas piscicida TaxID=43662 RepID=A0AAD0W6K8_PSEO7|nr:hypothetical protein [Pseudoalteromonas piscicida]ASD69572.1 hypothetical protein B1L02_22170 [Pseudoalteromonas piscicida]AXR04068.1 hypothetical protein D0511_19095 [Pseudoalteromonas piscicida]